MSRFQILPRAFAGLFFAIAAASGQTLESGSLLPPLEGEALSGTVVKLPEAARGKAALLVFGFSQDAAKPSRQFAERFEQELGSAGVAYQLPVIEGAPRLVRGLIRSGMRKETPKDAQGRMVPLVKDEAAWRGRLGIGKDKGALVALVVLDRQGRVRLCAPGVFSEALLRQAVDVAKKSE